MIKMKNNMPLKDIYIYDRLREALFVIHLVLIRYHTYKIMLNRVGKIQQKNNNKKNLNIFEAKSF